MKRHRLFICNFARTEQELLQISQKVTGYNHTSRNLIEKFNTIKNATSFLFPEFNLQPWRFNRVDENFWNPQNNRTHYFDWIAQQLNYKSQEDWYKIGWRVVADLYGKNMLDRYYSGSVITALTDAYPNYQFLPWKFTLTNRKFFSKPLNQYWYISWLTEELGIKKYQDFYDVQTSDIRKRYGKTLISIYGSTPNTILAMFPAYNFLWAPIHAWKNTQCIKELFKYLEKKLYISKPTDWLRVTRSQMIQFGAVTLIRNNKSMKSVITKIYPELETSSNSFQTKTQKFLFDIIKSIFPDEQIFMNFKHPELLFEKSSARIEIDVYLPKLNLGFEYQGQQHFEDNFFNGNKTEEFIARDNEKKLLCKTAGITIIEVPFWWDNSKKLLLDKIKELRPEIL